MARPEELVTNPELIEAIRASSEDASADQSRMAQALFGARLLVPVSVRRTIPAAPETSAKPKDTVLYQMIRNSGKQQFLLAFTDMAELRKWRSSPDRQAAILSFDECAALVLGASGVWGIAIDPLGINRIVTKETIRQLMRNRE